MNMTEMKCDRPDADERGLDHDFVQLDGDGVLLEIVEEERLFTTGVSEEGRRDGEERRREGEGKGERMWVE